MDAELNSNNGGKGQKVKKLSPFLIFVKHRKPALETASPGISMKDILF